TGVFDGECDTAGSRAHIEYPRRGVRTNLLESALDYLLGFGTRYENVRRYSDSQSEELRIAEDVLQGFVGLTPREHLAEGRHLRRGERLIELRIQIGSGAVKHLAQHPLDIAPGALNTGALESADSPLKNFSSRPTQLSSMLVRPILRRSLKPPRVYCAFWPGNPVRRS